MTFIPSYILFPREDATNSTPDDRLNTGPNLSTQAGIGLVVGAGVTFAIIVSCVIVGLFRHVKKYGAEECKIKALLRAQKARRMQLSVRSSDEKPKSKSKSLASSSTSLPLSPPKAPYRNPSYGTSSNSLPSRGIMKPQAAVVGPDNVSVIPAEFMRTEKR